MLDKYIWENRITGERVIISRGIGGIYISDLQGHLIWRMGHRWRAFVLKIFKKVN